MMEISHREDLRKLHHYLCAALVKFGRRPVLLDIALFSTDEKAIKLRMTLESRKFLLGVFRTRNCTLATVPEELTNGLGVLKAVPEFRKTSFVITQRMLSGYELLTIPANQFITDLEQVLVRSDPEYRNSVVKTVKTINLPNLDWTF